jgi:hypothetical protein
MFTKLQSRSSKEKKKKRKKDGNNLNATDVRMRTGINKYGERERKKTGKRRHESVLNSFNFKVEQKQKAVKLRDLPSKNGFICRDIMIPTAIYLIKCGSSSRRHVCSWGFLGPS